MLPELPELSELPELLSELSLEEEDSSEGSLLAVFSELASEELTSSLEGNVVSSDVGRLGNNVLSENSLSLVSELQAFGNRYQSDGIVALSCTSR